MKRDMELVRDILLALEKLNSPNLKGLANEFNETTDDAVLTEHVRMLIDEAGLVSGINASSMGGRNWLDLKLTWNGHDFLDSVRDPEIWRKTTQGAAAAGGFTLELLGDLAKGFIKKQIEEKTGVQL